MLMRRVVKFALSNAKIEVTKLPKAPTLLSGELENFRFDAEHSSLYDGYTLDELYGSKIGVKHSPAVKAEMRKDTIASILLFVVGFSIIWHLHQLDSQKLKELSSLNEQRLRRQVTLPEGLVNNIKKSYILQEDGM